MIPEDPVFGTPVKYYLTGVFNAWIKFFKKVFGLKNPLLRPG
jgi:hypothetical protein